MIKYITCTALALCLASASAHASSTGTSYWNASDNCKRCIKAQACGIKGYFDDLSLEDTQYYCTEVLNDIYNDNNMPNIVEAGFNMAEELYYACKHSGSTEQAAEKLAEVKKNIALECFTSYGMCDNSEMCSAQEDNLVWGMHFSCEDMEYAFQDGYVQLVYCAQCPQSAEGVNGKFDGTNSTYAGYDFGISSCAIADETLLYDVTGTFTYSSPCYYTPDAYDILYNHDF